MIQKVMKSKALIGVLAGVVILILVVVAVLVGTNSSGKADKDTESQQMGNGTHTEEMKEVQTAMETTMERKLFVIQLTTSEEETPNYLLKMEEKSSYEIISLEEQEENIYAAVVRVTAPDLYSVVKNMELEGELTEEQIDAAITAEIETADLVTTDVSMMFEYADEKWDPAFNEDFFDAYYGGIMRLRKEYYDERVEDR